MKRDYKDKEDCMNDEIKSLKNGICKLKVEFENEMKMAENDR